MNKVRTSVVQSALFYRSRVASAVGRFTQFSSGHAPTWHMLVADDFRLKAGEFQYRPTLIVFGVLCATCGFPLCGNKKAGDGLLGSLYRSH